MPVANFQFRGLKPSGWTANSIVAAQPSVVGPANAAAQNPVSADALMTTPQTLRDPSLGSRTYMNPNTGVRDVGASASVYSMPDVPPFLSQAVSSLNSEQALQRSLQAEWNNRLMQGATSGGPDAYLWQEALRAASVSPGASVNFGGAVQNPAAGRAAEMQAQVQAQAAATARSAAAQRNALQSQIARLSEGNNIVGGGNWMNQQNELSNLRSRLSAMTPPTGNSGWAPRPYWG